MSSNIREDAGPLSACETEQLPSEHNRRFSVSKSSQREERRRTSSTRSDITDCVFKNNCEIIISPEDIPDEYEHHEDLQGLFVLFNHEEFVFHDERQGTSKDQNDLVDCLSRLRYEIKQELLFKDYAKKEIEEELVKIVQMDHSKRSSLIVVFLTHGNADGKLYCYDGETITCEEIWNHFTADKCPSLKGKPKIFIFQACKGKQKSKVAHGVQEDSVPRVDMARKNYTLPAEADILVAYSTLEGNVSYRHTSTGSWFIQELCKNFTAYGRRDDIVTIFTRVSKCVAYHYQHHEYKQMPCFISTLTRKFYLCTSRERSYFLELREQNRKLLEILEKMQEQLDTLHKKEEAKDKNTGKTMTDKPFRQISNIRKTSATEKPRWK